MADLRKLFEQLGFRDVATLLNSGNVVFSAAGEPEEVLTRIERGLASDFGLGGAVTLLAAREVAAVVRENPFPRARPSDLLVMVPRKLSDKRRLRPLAARRWTPEKLALGKRVAYVWCAKGVPRSPLWAAVDRALERTGTVRNIATFAKAAASIEGEGE